MCLKNGFIISGTEKYENPIFIYVPSNPQLSP